MPTVNPDRKRLVEFYNDLDANDHKLTKWERDFRNTIYNMVDANKDWSDLSAAQVEAAERIDAKIQAAG